MAVGGMDAPDSVTISRIKRKGLVVLATDVKAAVLSLFIDVIKLRILLQNTPLQSNASTGNRWLHCEKLWDSSRLYLSMSAIEASVQEGRGVLIFAYTFTNCNFKDVKLVKAIFH